MRIKNEHGQFYAVECKTLEENNKVFEFINTVKIEKFHMYATTNDNIYENTPRLSNRYELITFNDWINLPKDPITEWISLPIEDYNRLRKLEIKQEIKKLKKELKGL